MKNGVREGKKRYGKREEEREMERVKRELQIIWKGRESMSGSGLEGEEEE